MQKSSDLPENGEMHIEILDEMTLSMLDEMKKVMINPIRKTSLSEISSNTKSFVEKYNNSSDFLTKIRKQTRFTKTHIEPVFGLIMKELAKMLKIYLKESLPKAMNEFTRIMESGPGIKNFANSVICLVKHVSIGAEAYCSIMSFLYLFIMNKQHQAEDVTNAFSQFKEFNDFFISNQNLVMLIDSDELFTGTKQKRFTLFRVMRKVYKKALKLMTRLKRMNPFDDQADLMLNVLEKTYIELIDSPHHMHNSIGFDILLYILELTDENYQESLSNLLIRWNKKQEINNIGRVFEILFIYGNENIKTKIAGEIGSLSFEEMYKFFSLFDQKMFEGYLEDGLLSNENTAFSYKAIQGSLELSVALKLKLQKLMTEISGKLLASSFEKIKASNDDQKEYEKFLCLMKISIIGIRSSIFAAKSALTKSGDTLQQISEEILQNPNKYKFHFEIIQMLVDLFHNSVKAIKLDICEKILDIILKSNEESCCLFAARIGNIYHQVDKSRHIQKMLITKLAKIFESMLSKDDFMQKFKALEGVLLVTNNSELGEDEIELYFSSIKTYKELLMKIEDCTEDYKDVPEIVSKSILSMMLIRSKNHKEYLSKKENRFKDMGKDSPFELTGIESGISTELADAFIKIEEAIKNLKMSKDEHKEYTKLQINNKINSLLLQLNGYPQKKAVGEKGDKDDKGEKTEKEFAAPKIMNRSKKFKVPKSIVPEEE